MLDLIERKSAYEGLLNGIGYRAVDITDNGHVLVLEITANVDDDIGAGG